ncbi:MAG: hypothetical protein JRI42_08210, partial [Deltaproteobacteria bacterium]|nr:hypothetical protein [Deltaproteobacteria bacterium]
LIMYLDIAHSLSDIFSLDKGLMDKNKGVSVKIEDRHRGGLSVIGHIFFVVG